MDADQRRLRKKNPEPGKKGPGSGKHYQWDQPEEARKDPHFISR